MSNYISGTYGLKYYAEWQNYREQVFRIEVQERGFAGTAKIMGDFQDAALEIQGDQGNVTAPIVKTQLRFSLVDSWDTQDTATTKYGGWEEFYTPDATRFLVVLKSWRNGAWETRWSGYITPDSWNENLSYRGSITVTVRDNIGHLQDFPFDLTGDVWGLVSLRSIITAAMQKINLPMDFQEANQNLPSIDGDGTNLLDSSVCIKTFEKDNWQSVLEDVLDSIGYTLRWTDFNRITLAPIRHIPLMGEVDEQEQEQQNPLEFYGGSRRLDPAFKQIVDTLDYDGDNSADLDIHAGLSFDGTRENYTIQYQKVGVVGSDTGWSYRNGGAADGYGWQAGYGFLDGGSAELSTGLNQEEGEDAGKIGAILCANAYEASFMPVYKARILSPAATIRIDFASMVAGLRPTAETDSMIGQLHVPLKAVRVYIHYQKGSSSRYWDGSAWSESSTYIDRSLSGDAQSGYSIEFTLGACDLADGGDLYIGFDRIACGMLTDADLPARGIYARIVGISLTANSARLESDKVTTTNNSEYNVTMDRKPAVGALSRAVPIVSPANYPNALFHVKNGVLQAFPYGVSWGQGQSVKPLPVLIHQQILMFHHSTLSVFDGECAPSGKVMPYFDAIWTYKGRRVLLQSGTWDLGTGVINGAVLREFDSYDDLWEDGGASWDGSSEYDKSQYKDRDISNPSSDGGGGTTEGVAKSVEVNGNTYTPNSAGKVTLPDYPTVPSDIATQTWVNNQGFITSISSSDIINALGFTPASQSGLNELGARISSLRSDFNTLNETVTGSEGVLERLDALEQGGSGGGSVVSWGTQQTTSHFITLTVNGTTKTLVQQAGYDALDSRISDLEDAGGGSRYYLNFAKTAQSAVIKEYNGSQEVNITAEDLAAILGDTFATPQDMEDALAGYVTTDTDVQTIQGFKKFAGGIGLTSAATASSGLRIRVVNGRIHIYGNVTIHGEVAMGDSGNTND